LHAKYRRVRNLLLTTAISGFVCRALSALLPRVTPKKRGKIVLLLFRAYRFLSISTITIVATTIAIMAAVPMPNTYVSVIGAGVGVGGGVACGGSTTFMAVTADDGQ
jgi:hypothetical protein